MASPPDIRRTLLEDEALRRRGVALVVDQLLARPLGDLVDVTGLTELAQAFLAAAPVARGLDDHAVPAVGRFLTATEEAELTVGELLPPAQADALEALVVDLRLPRFAWARDTVDGELLKKLFAPVLQELLLQFVGKLPGVGGFAGALAKMGGKATRGVGAGVQGIAREFSRAAVGGLRDALSARLASDEGRAIVREIRAQAFRRTLTVPLSTILHDLEGLPWAGFAGELPPIVEQNARSAFGRALLRAEIEAFLAVEGDKTLGAFLDEVGALPTVRAWVRVQAETLLGSLLADDAFGDWLTELAARA
ncbi:MAG TPA: hypothetical protein RMH85_34890 [Polyangiaceae bacterium LLY-WYZ-15_(1-7)]|nr:hypothetical protein [Polyangiaceae bacterium LLY-WYZ-15_(1-7)]HJL13725.1 hypothetical protein [Polyangiaceae bacterium LLY-WYZ-15_(1-7)]HJL23723.1 hypothetical protein [Polyangiaceae bacterium LLY-WYZ-15_(1-7)]HJL37098.1 hypothetical protein [Polyangiaceae bacterium LLY-WYZ-15_(1-7)]HJL50966.1 hypothetical protein [Polyangiaceae bacterium LLY-WYZ-15_(1-7)]